MIKSKLFSLLKKLKQNKGEIGEFERFVSSPYFNTKQEAIDLVAYIRTIWHLPEHLQAQKLHKEQVYKEVFPQEKKFINWKFHQCTSHLYSLLLKFLAIQEVDKATEESLLIQAYKIRDINALFFKASAQKEARILKKREQEQFLDANKNKELVDIQRLIYYHPNTDISTQKESGQRLISISNALDEYYLIRKLINYCEMSATQRVFEGSFNIPPAATILDGFSIDLNKNLLIKAYYEILSLFQTQDKTKIEPLRQLIFELLKKVSPYNKLKLFELFLNSWPPGTSLTRYLELYKYAWDERILIEGNYVSNTHLNNMIHIGCNLEEYDWTKQVIAESEPYLDNRQDKGENIKCLFYAYVNYVQANYHEAYRLLFNLVLEDINYGIRRHTILLRSLFLGKKEVRFRFNYDEKCNSFRTYLRRKYKIGEVSKRVKDANFAFVRILQKTYHAKNKKIPKLVLLEELKAIKEIPNRIFLKERINELDA